MFNELSKFDLISPRFELKFKGNEGYKTPLGSLFTFLIFCTTIFSIRGTILDFANTDNPSMSIQNFSINETSNVSASQIPIEISFEIAGGDRNKVNITTLPTPTITYSKQEPQKNTEGGMSTNSSSSKSNNTEKQEIQQNNNMSACVNSDGTTDLQNFCLDDAQTIVFATSQFQFEPPNETTTSTSTYVMLIEFPQLRYNISNYDNPYFFGDTKQFIFTETNKFSLRELLFTKKTIDIQDTGFIYYNQRPTVEFYQLDDIKLIFSMDSTTDEHSPKGHSFKFTISTTGDAISITYVTFDDVLSAFGGTFGSIFYIVQIIYGNICEYFMMSDLINIVFKFHSGNISKEIFPVIKLQNSTENQEQCNEHTNKPLEEMNKIKVLHSSPNTRPSIYEDQYYVQRKLFEKEFEEYQVKKLQSVRYYNDNEEQSLRKDQEREEFGTQLKGFVSILEDVNRGRQPYSFGCCQYFKAKCKHSFRLGKLNVPDKILMTAESIIETKMSYEFLAKSLNELQSLKHVMLDENLQDFIAMPSISINTETSIQKLNQFLHCSLKGGSEEMSIQGILESFSENGAWKKRKTHVLFKNFIKSIF